MKAKLTPRNVVTLEAPDEGRINYFDQTKGADGFVVRVSESARTFYVTYRLAGRFCWYKVGDVSRISLSQARAEGRRVLAIVELGGDPQAEREQKRRAAEAERAAGTFAALCQDFLAVREPDLRPRSIKYYRWLIDSKIAGTPLGRMGVADVTPADIERRLADVRVGSGGVTSNRLHQALTTVCRWARKKGKLQINYMENVDRPLKTEATRERVLTDAEVSCLLAALEGEAPAVDATVRLLLLLGQRSTATIEGLLSDGVDLAADIPTWTIPGRFQKKGHLLVVPLPPQAITIIEPLVKPGTSERVLNVDTQNWNRWWSPVRDRALALAAQRNLTMEHFTRHDLRRTCMTGMTKLGVTRFIAQRVIGHAEQGVGGIYDRNDYLREKAVALATWGSHVERIESGDQRRADVLPLRRA